MKTKPHSSSRLAGLSPERRQQLDDWLFNENVSYDEATRRCRERFAIKICPSSFVRYYRRRESERLLERIAASAEKATALTNRFKDDQFCEAFCLLMGRRAFDSALSDSSPASEQPASANPGPVESEAKPGEKAARRPPPFDALTEAAALFTSAMKLKFNKQGQELERERFKLELRKYKEHAAQQKQKIGSVLATGKRKGGVSEAMLREIEEAANLL